MDNRGYRDEQFIPETVDEQVEQLSQISTQADGFSSTDARLIHNLYSVSREYATTRDRVWDRLLAHAGAATQNVQPAETNKIQELPPERVHTVKQEGLYPRRTGVQRIELIAAALVAAVLVGSILLVLSLARHQNGEPAGSGHQQVKATASAASSLQPFCNKQDAGWYAICSTHQEKLLDITKTIDGKVISIKAAYADNNRVIVAYTITFTTKNVGPPFDTSINTLNAQGINLDSLGSSGFYNARTNINTTVASFDTINVPEHTNILNLHLEMTFFAPATSPSPNGGGQMKKAGTLSTNFSLPFHSGREANVNQTVTVDGIPITLARVIVSPSETRLYVKSSRLQLGGGLHDPYYLAVDDWNTNARGFDEESVLTQTGKGSPFTGVMLIINSSLFDKHGQWTFRVSSGAVIGGSGTWVFHFTVPAA